MLIGSWKGRKIFRVGIFLSKKLLGYVTGNKQLIFLLGYVTGNKQLIFYFWGGGGGGRDLFSINPFPFRMFSINPFVPGDLDQRRLDLSYFGKLFWNEASVRKIFEGKLQMEF